MDVGHRTRVQFIWMIFKQAPVDFKKSVGLDVDKESLMKKE